MRLSEEIIFYALCASLGVIAAYIAWVAISV